MSKLGKKQIRFVYEYNPLLNEPIKYNQTIYLPTKDSQTGNNSQLNNLVQSLVFEGPKGQQSIIIPNILETKITEKIIKESKELNKQILIIEVNINSNFENSTKMIQAQKSWGTLWTLINQMLTGVSIGFKSYIKLTGIGYKAQIESQNLLLNIGFSHPVSIDIPKNIHIDPKNIQNTSQGALIEVTSNSLSLLNNFVFLIQKIKPAKKSFKGSGISVIKV